MDIQGVADTLEKLDEPAKTIFQTCLLAERIDLLDEPGVLSAQAEDLADDIESVDADELQELQEKVDDDAAVGPLLAPEKLDAGTAHRMKRRTDAFVDAHERLQEAVWEKDRYEALEGFVSAV